MDIPKKIGDASNKLKKLASSARDSVSKNADKVSMELKVVRSTISETGSSNLEQYVDRVFPRCTAPAYILHHSSSVNDYSVHFDLTYVLSQLNSGILSRPSVILYSGRSDIDRELLSERVIKEFMIEMKVHEQRVKDLAESTRREHRDALGKSVKNVIVGAAEAAFMRAVLTIVTGPLGLAVLLLFGSAGKTVDGIYEMISMPKKIVMAGVESIKDPQSDKKVKTAIEEEHKKINKALTSIDLKMHRDHISLAGSFDNTAYPFRGDRVSDELPGHIINLIQKHAGEYLPQRLRFSS